MKILIIPTIREIYKNQFEFSVDIRLINFLKKIFKNSSIKIYNSHTKDDYQLVVLAGGNNSIFKNNADRLRNKINNYIYRFSLKKNKPILGICHGAHYLAQKNDFKIAKKSGHVGNHKVVFKIDEISFKKIVNSYHMEIIKFKNNENINVFGLAEDKSIEAFHIKKKKILGIVWHPERYNKIKYFDLNLIRKFYATNSIISR
tara:strand:- start:17227 stop:17832 length:606 start_codon:yes stop_codon:yes gene_type:complete